MSGSRPSPHDRVDEIRVLYVDDDPEFADLVATYLERTDGRLTVETATSVTGGLDRLADTQYDCIVSDYEMPGQTGIEFLETVRRNHPELPFILYTGKGSEEVASEAISSGVTDYLRKRSGADQYALLANRIHNATEQYRTNRALDDFRARIEFALSVTDSIIFEADPDSKTEVRHGPFERLFGVESETVPNTRAFLNECVHPEDREKVKSLQNPAELPIQDTVEQEFRTHPDNGDTKWIYNEMYADTDAEGNPQRLVGLNTDVTERKRHEQRLERQNQQLEQLASVVSHDLRNPLTVASGKIELARGECDSTHLEDAAKAIDRMETLISDLLTLARTGDPVREPEDVSLPRLIEECRRSVRTGEATVVCETEKRVRANRSRLKQLLENLISNAVEHGDEAVTVRIGASSKGFYVCDDGSGIPEEERDDVFESGYSTIEGGTGFGLSIVREIVKAHGWEIDVVESSDGGARFEITGLHAVDE